MMMDQLRLCNIDTWVYTGAAMRLCPALVHVGAIWSIPYDRQSCNV
jgi:hypothetical protein